MGEIESRKEFITRMFLFMNELPKEKKNDFGTILCFLEFQMRLREMEFIKASVRTMIAGATKLERMNYSQKAKLIQMVEDSFSEVDFTFIASTDDEKMEFLVNKNTDKYKDRNKEVES